MFERNSESPRQSLAETPGGRAFWLTDPDRGLLLPLTGIWILALDWLLFSSNVLSAGIATPLVVVLGFFLGRRWDAVSSKMDRRRFVLESVVKSIGCRSGGGSSLATVWDSSRWVDSVGRRVKQAHTRGR